jgi:hypothetical protein
MKLAMGEKKWWRMVTREMVVNIMVAAGGIYLHM